MYVCLCRGITDQDIKDAVANAESYREIRDLLDLGTCCSHLCTLKHVLLLVMSSQKLRCSYFSCCIISKLIQYLLTSFNDLFYDYTASCRTLTIPQISGFLFRLPT